MMRTSPLRTRRRAAWIFGLLPGLVFLAAVGAQGALAQEFPATLNNRALALGDLDGDGLIDIVAAGDSPLGEGGIAVLFGAPGGTFVHSGNMPAGHFPVGVAVGDVNGDGIPDIVASSNSPDELVILTGAGGRQFFDALHVPTGEYPRGLAVGDLNGDLFMDAAVAASFTDTVQVHLGDGAGSLGGAAPHATGEFPYSLVMDDLNGDAAIDLAVANLLNGSVSIFLGSGAGTFGAEHRVATGFGPHSIIAGDFNLDGRRDLATCNRDGGTVSVLLGDGLGGFAAPISSPVEPGLFDLATGDFNSDGKPDLATESGYTSRVHVLTGDGTGRFRLGQVFTAGPLYPVGFRTWDVLTHDFDGDGNLDLAWDYLGLVNIARGRGDGTFVGSDMDGDGIPDATDPCIDIDRDDRGDPGYPTNTCASDNCPLLANSDQADGDFDGYGDACDNCPAIGNPRQEAAACEQTVVNVTQQYNMPQGRGTTTVRWETTPGEYDVVSFNVIVLGATGRVQLNATPIPCQACDTGAPAAYSFVVDKHQSGRSFYVEMRRNTGVVETFGPAIRQ